MPNGTGDYELKKMKEKTFCQNGLNKGKRHVSGPWQDGEINKVFRVKICNCMHCGIKMHEEVFK